MEHEGSVSFDELIRVWFKIVHDRREKLFAPVIASCSMNVLGPRYDAAGN